MENKDILAVAYKEYDALRKEIELRTDATKNYGWPVVVVFAALSTGLIKQDLLTQSLVWLMLPFTIMVIMVLTANANSTIAKSRRKIAILEVKINRLAGTDILSEETNRLDPKHNKHDQLTNSKVIFLLQMILIILYIILQYHFLKDFFNSFKSPLKFPHKAIVCVIVYAPALSSFYHNYNIFINRKPLNK